ncbi:MAG: hypothetical protein E7588_10040 [Ruminococcaceae bacterium]|nr:hypothetical protein [Oscillospiraceae bacterium]
MIEKEALFYYPIERFTGLNVPDSDQTALKAGESPYMKNFTITDTYSIKKRDGYTQLYDFADGTRAVFADNGESPRLFIASGTDIYTCPLPFDSANLKKAGSVADSDNCFFMKFGLKVYLWGGGKIQVYDEEKQEFSDIEPYIPLVAVSCNYLGAGTPFEQVNMLTGKLRKQYTIDEDERRTFYIGDENCVKIDWLKYNGEIISADKYTFFPSSNGFNMDSGEAIPQGINVLEVCYSVSDKLANENKKKITDCRYCMFYGGENDTKVFLWGNPDYPDARMWSEMADGMPSAVYFGENNFTRIGDGSPIRDIIRQYDRQLIFCDNAAYLSYIEEKTDELGRNYFSFPVRTISDNKGSLPDAQAKLIENAPVTLCHDGLYKWISTAQRDERNTHAVSTRINALLLEEELEKAKMYDFESRGELYIYFPNGKVYIYRYRADVFCMYDNIFAHTFFRDNKNSLYFCDNDGKLFVFESGADDNGAPIDCQWQSGYMDINFHGNKNLYYLGITYQPAETTSLSVGCTDDSDTDAVMTRVKLPVPKSPHETKRSAKIIKHRMRTKRFQHIKLMIKDSTSLSKIHINRISLNGRYTHI